MLESIRTDVGVHPCRHFYENNVLCSGKGQYPMAPVLNCQQPFWLKPLSFSCVYTQLQECASPTTHEQAAWFGNMSERNLKLFLPSDICCWPWPGSGKHSSKRCPRSARMFAKGTPVEVQKTQEYTFDRSAARALHVRGRLEFLPKGLRWELRNLMNSSCAGLLILLCPRSAGVFA